MSTTRKHGRAKRRVKPAPGKKKSSGGLTPRQAKLLEAAAARIFPATDTPGAVEAGALRYIGQALVGPYRSLLPLYRSGLSALERRARAAHGDSFLALSEAKQDGVLEEFEAGQVAGFQQGAEFFTVLRRHVLEGVFGEPSYGGNENMVGWRLVGFPGQRFGYEDPYINREVDLPPVAVEGVPKPDV